MNCGWGNSTVFCVSRAFETCLCVLMWGQLHHCDGLFQHRRGISTSMICSTIRSGICSWHVSFVCKQPSSLCLQCHPTNYAAPLLVANSETQVAPTFTVEDSLLLVLGPGQVKTLLLVHLDFVVLRYAVLVLFSVVPWQLGDRRSCPCTEAVGHQPMSVPSESQAPVVALLQECS